MTATSWASNAKLQKLGRLGRPARVGFRGDVLGARAQFNLVPCIGVWLTVTLTCCCSRRGWSRDGAENSKTCKVVQCGEHHKLNICKHATGANANTWGDRTLVISTRIAFSFLLGTLLHGDMAFQIWPKMAQTAKVGRNHPHSRYHTPMIIVSNNLNKDATDTWDLDPNISGAHNVGRFEEKLRHFATITR